METPQQYPDSGSGSRRRILVVDDDPSLRLLLRETLPADEFELEEVASAEEARDVARFWRPSVVLLDVSLPGLDGLSFCKQLTKGAAQGEPVVILLTGTEMTDAEARESGARAILRKPFSPLELIGLVDRLDETPSELLVRRTEGDAEQLLIYARDPSLEYGFLLHDVGKIGIADQLLNKRGPLTTDERRVIELHPTIGAEILAGVAMLHGEGLKVVNFHHERWDGCGYPAGLAGEAIPQGARIFALADALDAMTSDRPYRAALSWEQAIDQILSEDGGQFDPKVVRAFCVRERQLRRIYNGLAAVAA